PAAAGVRLTVVCAAETDARTGVSDEHGMFRFENLPIDTCNVTTDLQGFATGTLQAVTASGQVTTLRFVLETTPLFSGVVVTGTTPASPRTTSRTSCAWRSDVKRDRSACAGRNR